MARLPPDWLPDERPAPARARKVALVVALTLAALLGVNALAGVALQELTTNRGYWLVHEKWSLLESLEAPADWLILGDSAGNQGVRPDVVTAELGGSAVNLCTIGDLLAVNDAWMLERHIERLGPPRNVILVHVYDVWYRGLRFLNRQPLLAKIPLPWGFWEDMDPPVTLSAKDERRLLLARYVPLWSENKTLSSWLRHPSKVLDRDFRLTAEGFMPLEEPNAKNVKKDSREHLGASKRKHKPMAALNRDALDRIGALADEHGFDVWVATSPVWEGVWRDKRFRSMFQAVVRQIQAVAKRHPRLHVILPTPATFPASAMENVDHLTNAAAAVYTKKLAAAIRAGRGQTR